MTKASKRASACLWVFGEDCLWILKPPWLASDCETTGTAAPDPLLPMCRWIFY